MREAECVLKGSYVSGTFMKTHIVGDSIDGCEHGCDVELISFHCGSFSLLLLTAQGECS